MESVLTTQKGVCYLCCKVTYTHLHHIIHAGVSKKTQERMGLVVYLCPKCHDEVHRHIKENDRDRDYDLKAVSQFLWEQKYINEYPYQNHAEEAAREAWMKQIGRNYL